MDAFSAKGIMPSLNRSDCRVSACSIPRPRLFSRLHQEFSRHRAVLLHAPAGFGKSTLLSQFLHRGLAPCIWYNASSEDGDPAVMLNSLVSVILRKHPNADARSSFFLEKAKAEASWKAKCEAVLGFLAALDSIDVYLILDDIHKAGRSEAFQKALDLFIQNSPENLWIALSSRGLSGFKPSKYLLYNQAGILTSHELCFTVREIQQLFHEQYGASLSREQAEQINYVCAGWPLGASLVARYLGGAYAGADLENIELQSLFQSHGFSGYLGKELLEDLPRETREFLTSSSIFDCFTSEMGREILEEDNADRIINYLFDQGLLQVKTHSDDTWYESPAMFRNYFLDSLKEQIPWTELSKIHEITGLYFASSGFPLEAVKHFLSAQAYGKAVTILEKNLEHCLAKSPPKELLAVTRGFPDSYKDAKSVISLTKGWALFVIGSGRKSLHFLEKALKMAQGESHAGVIGLTVRITANILFSMGSYGELVAFIRQWKHKLTANTANYLEILGMFAQALGHLGYLDEAEAVWEELEAHHMVQRNESVGLVVTAVKAYHYSFLHGWFHAAGDGMRKALKAFAAGDAMGIYPRVLGYYSTLSYIQGHFDKCLELMQQAISECDASKQVFARQPFLLLQAMYAVDSGRPEIAREALEKFHASSMDVGFSVNAHGAYMGKGYLLYAVKAALAEAEGDLRQFFCYADAAIQGAGEKESFPDFYFLSVLLAVRYIKLGRQESAQELLEDLTAFLGPIDTPYFKAHARLLFASSLCGQGRLSEASFSLKRAVSLARQHGYEDLFLYKERSTVLQLQDLLLREEENFAFIAGILVQLDPAVRRKLCRSLKEESAEKKVCIIQALADHNCCDGEREILACASDRSQQVRRIAKASAEKLRRVPPQPLGVYTFGGFRLQVGAREVQWADWKRKKAAGLFHYFLMRPDKRIACEKLMDIFFPEDEPAKAKMHVQALVSHLRHLLEPGLPQKKESKYIRADNGAYLFQLPEDSYVDAFDFSRLIAEAAQARKNGRDFEAFQKCSAAATLYKGDFLPEAVYEEWAQEYRRYYAEQYCGLLHALAQEYFDRRDYPSCENCLRALLSRDPLEEKAYFLLMKCYAARDNRVRSIRTYLQCRDILRKELGTTPEKSLTELYQRLRNSVE